MNLFDIQKMVRAKELGLCDMGPVTIVKPTGRFIDCFENGAADLVEPRHRWVVEVRGGLFSTRWWVLAQNLKTVCVEQKE